MSTRYLFVLLMTFVLMFGSSLIAQGQNMGSQGGGTDIYQSYKHKTYNVHHAPYVPSNNNYYNSVNNKNQSWRN